jgi:hypothetical protein
MVFLGGGILYGRTLMSSAARLGTCDRPTGLRERRGPSWRHSPCLARDDSAVEL